MSKEKEQNYPLIKDELRKVSIHVIIMVICEDSTIQS